ncbi:hypothetical protein [Legionella drancourtii]|uniref:Uncharacterized protein n=1 Tax=Legionella drancourtii LLAP12 TaxID=658187 RepID=G9EQD0_9GAMM|nr:hypothetical protein [Legionella drancourtii]EHL30525.1 hypothetical protein LDG_7477 [Legionella drancourtii LLAP12]
MNAALMYCDNKFKKALTTIHKNKAIYEAFEALEMEIKKMDYLTQLNLYSATTQFLESLIHDSNDSINPLEVFVLRCNSIVDDKHDSLKKIGLALGVIAISIAVVMTGAALGIGIGMMLSMWQTPLMFMTALFAAETAPLIVASSSIAQGIGAGLLSQFLFFKEPKIKKALDNCVDAIKQSHLSTIQAEESKEDGFNDIRIEAEDTATSSPVLH